MTKTDARRSPALNDMRAGSTLAPPKTLDQIIEEARDAAYEEIDRLARENAALRIENRAHKKELSKCYELLNKRADEVQNLHGSIQRLQARISTLEADADGPISHHSDSTNEAEYLKAIHDCANCVANVEREKRACDICTTATIIKRFEDRTGITEARRA